MRTPASAPRRDAGSVRSARTTSASAGSSPGRGSRLDARTVSPAASSPVSTARPSDPAARLAVVRPAVPVDLAWPRLTGAQQRSAVGELGVVLNWLHRWRAPPAVREMLAQAALDVPATRLAVAGSMIVPLPGARLALLLDGWTSGPGWTRGWPAGCGAGWRRWRACSPTGSWPAARSCTGTRTWPTCCGEAGA